MDSYDIDGSERSFFTEKDLVLESILSLPTSSTESYLEEKYESVKRILDRYQEQPQLLGPHTEEILKPLNDTLVTYIDEMKPIDGLIHTSCKVVQILCKVRGAKQCSKYLPHEVHQLEPCVAYLNAIVSIAFTHFDCVSILIRNIL